MKRTVITLICTASLYPVFSQNGNSPGSANGQGNTHWQVNGNVADSNNYIGTKNKQDLIFKSNQNESFRITPQQEFIIKGDVILDHPRPIVPGEKNILTVDDKGKLTSLDKSGLLQGIYSPLPECFMLQDMNGGNAVYPAPVWSAGSTPNFGVLYTGTICPARVGIGTDQPKASLDVIGNIKGNRLFLTSQMPANLTEHYFYLKAPLSSNTDAEIFRIENNSRKIFQINNKGMVRAREIKVDMETWPDYVFEKNYPLMPLKEVEAYISQHKHLPEVPSQNTVQEEGINLGEMNKILIQKVEELTLYLIEQQKQLEAQQKEIDLLKTNRN